MLTYKDSLRQRLYSDSFEEGLRFGIKYFAKKVLYELKDLANKKFKLGNKTYDYFQLRGMNLSDEAMLAAANAKGTSLSGNEFVLKGGKNFKAAQNNEAYQNMIAEHGGVGFGGDYSKYGDWYDKLDPAIQARLGGKMKEKEFKKMMTGQHDLEREYASQYFGAGNSGGASGSKANEEGGVWNWIKENPGKTAAIGGGALVTGLGARALLKGRDDRDDRYYR